ncbi:MAG: type II toxin-antitoxin system VapC family toxin [Deltaproteobacteria bacterium]|nr:type II toxin-antitoxin system VapC family toxin [Deltaproteobacteria bacterium]
MRFWDSSAIIPLLVLEADSDYCLKALATDQGMIVWCLSYVEVFSALCRRAKEGLMDETGFQAAKTRLKTVFDKAYQVKAIDLVRYRASRLLEVHNLRAADACQLAAALVVTQEDPGRLFMMCLDKRLETAARKEGFSVNPP